MTTPTPPSEPGLNPYAGATPVAPAAAKMNVLAIISLVGSIIGFSLIASVLGFVALSQIKKTGESGRGLAIAGVIIGIVATVFYLVLAIVSVVASIGSAGFSYTTY